MKILTSFDPLQPCGVGMFAIEHLDLSKLTKVLFEKHKIFTISINMPSPTEDGEKILGIRVTLSIYTTLHELDLFIEAVSHYIRHGLPA